MFAEDVGLLPNNMFTRMLQVSARQAHEFETHARQLFAAMKSGGSVGFERVEYFNGGLFEDDSTLPLAEEDIKQTLEVALLDWSNIDPSIMGTLFERGLDPDKRSQLGAHYTDRDKIMLIVIPVIIEPLTREWEETKAKIETLMERHRTHGSKGEKTKAYNEAQALHRAFIEKLKSFRVLDPACGSGNFLYLSLLALKDLEHRANLDAEVLGLPRGFPVVGPQCVKGIEINLFAAELARVSIWIGEIQWMKRNGFDAARNPILKALETIECRDALLNPDGTEAKWPEAHVIIGNPPFLGDKRMLGVLGEEYVSQLRSCYTGRVKGGADLVIYWFAKAFEQMRSRASQRAGLVATQSVRRGASSNVLKTIVSSGKIFNAWSDEEWTVEGADVRVSLICFDLQPGGKAELDGKRVSKIYADLTAADFGGDLTRAAVLTTNVGAYIGDQKTGPFDIDGTLARSWLQLPLNPNGRPNSDVLKPWANGNEVTGRWSDKWIIDFGVDLTERKASLYEAPFAYVVEAVRSRRAGLREVRADKQYWLHQRPRPEMRRAVSPLARYIVTPRVAKHRLFVWLNRCILPDSRLVVIAREDETTFGILHSRFHELWTLRLGGWHAALDASAAMIVICSPAAAPLKKTGSDH
jgi:type II restriction/modification system DNA methylase subunit YeeA